LHRTRLMPIMQYQRVSGTLADQERTQPSLCPPHTIENIGQFRVFFNQPNI
jgi:hypothetical protein